MQAHTPKHTQKESSTMDLLWHCDAREEWTSFQKLSSSVNITLHTHDQRLCPHFCFVYPGGQVMSLPERGVRKTESEREVWRCQGNLWHPYCSQGKHWLEVKGILALPVNLQGMLLPGLTGSTGYDLWPFPPGMVLYLQLWLLYKLQNTITRAIVVKWPYHS